MTTIKTRKRPKGEVDGQAPLDGMAVLSVPDLPGSELAVQQTTARDVVAAYCDGATEAGMPKPPQKSIKRIGRDAKVILEAGEIDPAEVLAAAFAMGATPWDDLDRQIRFQRQSSHVGNTGRRFGAAANADAGLELLGQLRAMEASGG